MPKATSLADALRALGVSSLSDIDRVKGNNSRYGWLCENLGQVNADRILRAVEVGSWFPPMAGGR